MQVLRKRLVNNLTLKSFSSGKREARFEKILGKQKSFNDEAIETKEVKEE